MARTTGREGGTQRTTQTGREKRSGRGRQGHGSVGVGMWSVGGGQGGRTAGSMEAGQSQVRMREAWRGGEHYSVGARSHAAPAASPFPPHAGGTINHTGISGEFMYHQSKRPAGGNMCSETEWNELNGMQEHVGNGVKGLAREHVGRGWAGDNVQARWRAA